MVSYIDKNFAFITSKDQEKYNNIFNSPGVDTDNKNFVCDRFIVSNNYLLD